MAPPVTLPTRLIGDTPVSAMGFGAMGFSAFYIPKDKTDEGRLKVGNFLTIWELYADDLSLTGPRRRIRERLHLLGMMIQRHTRADSPPY